jgi:hypothetical protein
MKFTQFLISTAALARCSEASGSASRFNGLTEWQKLLKQLSPIRTVVHRAEATVLMKRDQHYLAARTIR